jgi:transposase-like protein
LPEALKIIKDFDLASETAESIDRLGAEALARVLHERMDVYIDRHLAELEKGLSEGEASQDRRNGSYIRHLVTGLGNIEVEVPRTRQITAACVLKKYARRSRSVDQAILGCFVLGLSTRKVSRALAPILGERVSASTVSKIAKSLDVVAKAYHERPLTTRYRAVLFDGVVLSRRTGAGAIRRPVLVALGILHDGKKEVIDWTLASSESERECELFLTSLFKRGLTAENMEIIGLDGGKGMRAAIDTVYPGVPVQRCWAHKVRNITDKVREKDREAVKRKLRRIYDAKNIVEARKAARRFATAFEKRYTKAVDCLRRDLDELLTFYIFDDPNWRRKTRTTNAIERRFREVRRRTRPMGVFSDKTSIERILYAVFTNENRQQGVTTLFAVTHNN